MTKYYPLIRKLLFALQPEQAHRVSLLALKSGFPWQTKCRQHDRLRVEVAGLSFPNPIGIAAGFDKNAEVADALIALGFGFAEVGSVTPKPQAGNRHPRIFRLPEDQALINRLGFNNKGHDFALKKLKSAKHSNRVIGVNIGANKDSADFITDYEKGIAVFAEVASYLTINVSSPNTPGLRNFQSGELLDNLLARTTLARDVASRRIARRLPLLLKIAPDLTEADLDEVASAINSHSADGLIISNTTLSRDGVSNTKAVAQAGGLSGRPLFDLSTKILAKMRKRLGDQKILVGVGGVDSVESALEKIKAGADLVQLYTGIIYQGPGLPETIVTGMNAFMQKEGIHSLREIRDIHVAKWADQPI